VKVELNGRVLDVAEDTTIADLVREAGAPAGGRGVAVAVEGEVVPQSAWTDTHVTPGQSVEVLEARQGG
jgi:sulfur carrier protein